MTRIIIALVFRLRAYILRTKIRYGYYKTSVQQLHSEYLSGKELPFEGLCMFLRPHQLNDFIMHHNQIKEAFEIYNMATLEDMSPEFQKYIAQFPELESLLIEEGQLLNSHARRRLIFALGQLDTVIENGKLEKEVTRQHGGQNVVRRIDN